MNGPTSSPAPLLVSFEVEGRPTAKGNMMRFGPGRYVDVTKGLAEWMNAVQVGAMRERMRLGRTMIGPLHCDVRFRLPMPKSRPARARHQGHWASTVKPDADKLLRAVYDSLTRSHLILDDAQIATGCFSKCEVADDWTGCAIDLWEVAR